MENGEYETSSASSNSFKTSKYVIQEKKIVNSPVVQDLKSSFLKENYDHPMETSMRAGQCSQAEDLETIVQIKYDDLNKLKNSTKKLLCLIDEIQAKTYEKSTNSSNQEWIETASLTARTIISATEVFEETPLKQLELQTKNLDAIYIDTEEDDCSVYKRLTRKCHCLNRREYNDFIIHFNENCKYFSSNAGEIIKNIRILKRFLYMGGEYTKNALLFLNEGLAQSSHSEKIEIIGGCSFADICNVFEEHSIVIICVSWPCKYETYGDSMTQALAAGFLYKLSLVEEGRRYLNYSSKINNDLKRILRKKASILEIETVEMLNGTLNMLHKALNDQPNITYYCRPSPSKGMGSNIINVLLKYRQHMTLDEVFIHLNLLRNLSSRESGILEITKNLPILLTLFKYLLLEYDNSQINIILINILNDIVAANSGKRNSIDTSDAIDTDTSTEPKVMKNEMEQFPPKRSNLKKFNSKLKSVVVLPTIKGKSTKEKLHKQKDVFSSIIVVPLDRKLKEEKFKKKNLKEEPKELV